jgi:hypothetical protein
MKGLLLRCWRGASRVHHDERPGRVLVFGCCQSVPLVTV